MKMTIEVDCSPEEARRFLGLPDITPLNEHLVSEMGKRIDANIAMLDPQEFMKNWMSFSAGAQDQLRKMMEAGLGGGTTEK